MDFTPALSLRDPFLASGQGCPSDYVTVCDIASSKKKKTKKRSYKKAKKGKRNGKRVSPSPRAKK